MAIPNEEDEAEITEEEGVEYEQLRPTYTHEALLKLVEEVTFVKVPKVSDATVGHIRM